MHYHLILTLKYALVVCLCLKRNKKEKEIDPRDINGRTKSLLRFQVIKEAKLRTGSKTNSNNRRQETTGTADQGPRWTRMLIWTGNRPGSAACK